MFTLLLTLQVDSSFIIDVDVFSSNKGEMTSIREPTKIKVVINDHSDIPRDQWL